MRITTITLMAASALLAGCSTLQLNPIVNETRTVRSAADATKTVTIPEGMVWYDSAPSTHGLRFPPGVYVLEAEDAEYWYLRSSAPLEFRVFQNGQVTAARNIPGGIMIGRTSLQMVPAAGYIDGEGSTKVMVWKLGNDFLNREGRDWKKSF